MQKEKQEIENPQIANNINNNNIDHKRQKNNIADLVETYNNGGELDFDQQQPQNQNQDQNEKITSLEVKNSDQDQVQNTDQDQYPKNQPEKDTENSKSRPQNNLGGYKDEITKEIRLGFIKKVYAILTTQLLFTVFFIGLTFIDSFAKFLINYIAIFYTCCAISFIILIALLCFKKIARKSPVNYILLLVFTLCEAWMVATSAVTYEKNSVLVAGVLTAAVTISLTIYACKTKKDFTYKGGILFAGSCIMLVMGIFFMIFGISNTKFPLLNILYCGLGVLLYSLYLIFDTQLIMGRYGNEYSIDDYIFAALNIYLDIIYLFLYILGFFNR